jgi:hypothetical protein
MHTDKFFGGVPIRERARALARFNAQISGGVEAA